MRVMLCALLPLIVAQFVPIMPMMQFNPLQMNSAFNQQALLQTTEPTVTYQSDVSGKPLRFGDFYHKSGEAYDITKGEYAALPQREQLKFVPILSREDLRRVKSDYQVHSPQRVEKPAIPGPPTPSSSPEASVLPGPVPSPKIPIPDNTVIMSRSDISNEELRFGDWFHKVGSGFDVNGAEYLAMPATERHNFVEINSQRDFERFIGQPASAAIEPPAESQTAISTPSSDGRVTKYKSDISHEELIFGNFYHKTGYSYDISFSEYHNLDSAEQEKYEAINSQADLNRILNDYPSSASDSVRTAYRSDMSNQPLKYGNWFHRVGTAKDVDAEEFDRLAPQEKGMYVAINSDADLKLYQLDYSAKYRSDISDTPLTFGNFYHKVGQPWDINGAEYKAMPELEKSKYVLIDNEAQLQNYVEDYSQSSTHVVKSYRSNFSGQNLAYGNFFHKAGQAYDISRPEWEALPVAQKPLFVAIDSPADLEPYTKDYNTAGAWVTRWRSDVSREVLEFGKFYHKAGAAYDINQKEYLALPASEQAAFVRIDNAQDLLKYTNDWQHAAQASSKANGKVNTSAVQPPTLNA